MIKRAFLLLLSLSLGLMAWAQESPLRDFDPDTIRTLYFDYRAGGESLGPYPDFDGVAVQLVADSLGNYEDRLTDVRTKRPRFTIRHEVRSGHAEMRMYYPNGALRLIAWFLDESKDTTSVAFFVPSLRRPLSADALLDGDLTTYYPDGTIRQQSVYQKGLRIKSQCYDFRRRAAACNNNPLIVAAHLPAQVYGHQPFDYMASVLDKGHRSVKSKALYLTSPRDELRRLQIFLPKNEISSESVALVKQGTVVPINFAIVAKASGSRFTGSRSEAGNHELTSIALNAGSLFGSGLKPAMIDGEEVTTYFSLPVEFKLK